MAGRLPPPPALSYESGSCSSHSRPSRSITNARSAELKQQFEGREQELGKLLAESYGRVTGVKKESITLDQARDGFIKAQVEMELQMNAVAPGKIVNPARLLAALKR
jgi:hypothetical protein